jgi:peptide/nickel transport system permease protein
VLRYIVSRLIAVIPVLFGVSLIIFLLVHFAPGDATLKLLGPMASDESRDLLRRTLGLDQPVYVQYVKWLGEVLKGNFGTSIATSLPVADLVVPRFLNTVILTIPSLVLALWIGFFVGMFAAAKPFSLFDRIGMSFTLLLGSTPPFWLGLILVLFFALNWRIFPATGMVSMRGDGGLLDILHHLVLPAITTAAAPAAIITRMVRSSMLDILSQDYIKVARAKGVSQRLILWKHALRNAMPPIATITGLQLGYLLGGALFTEVVFAWPGLGNQLYYAIVARDLPVVQAAVLLIALSFVLVNLLTDILNAYLDPKIRIE